MEVIHTSRITNKVTANRTKNHAPELCLSEEGYAMSRSRSLLLSLLSLMVATPAICLPALAQSFGDAFSSQAVEIMASPKNDKILRYVAAVSKACSKRWPNTKEKFYSPLRVSFKVEYDGTIKHLRIKDSSGFEKWDKKAIATVQGAQPFGKLPFDYRRDNLPLTLEFKSGPPVTHTFLSQSMPGRLYGQLSHSRFFVDNNLRGAVEALTPKKKPTISAQRDVDFGPYMAKLQRRIKTNFSPLPENENMRVVLVFKVWKNGRVTNTRIVTGSPSKAFDNKALAAVAASNPLLPLPEGAPDDVDIQFTFVLVKDLGIAQRKFDIEVFPFGVPVVEKQLYLDELPETEFRNP